MSYAPQKANNSLHLRVGFQESLGQVRWWRQLQVAFCSKGCGLYQTIEGIIKGFWKGAWKIICREIEQRRIYRMKRGSVQRRAGSWARRRQLTGYEGRAHRWNVIKVALSWFHDEADREEKEGCKMTSMFPAHANGKMLSNIPKRECRTRRQSESK